MRRLALGAFSLVALAGAASAADMPVKAPFIAPPPVFSWTGCYIGGNVGGIKNDSKLTQPVRQLIYIVAARATRRGHLYI